jgi:hypothetical protein
VVACVAALALVAGGAVAIPAVREKLFGGGGRAGGGSGEDDAVFASSGPGGGLEVVGEFDMTVPQPSFADGYQEVWTAALDWQDVAVAGDHVVVSARAGRGSSLIWLDRDSGAEVWAGPVMDSNWTGCWPTESETRLACFEGYDTVHPYLIDPATGETLFSAQEFDAPGQWGVVLAGDGQVDGWQALDPVSGDRLWGQATHRIAVHAAWNGDALLGLCYADLAVSFVDLATGEELASGASQGGDAEACGIGAQFIDRSTFALRTYFEDSQRLELFDARSGQPAGVLWASALEAGSDPRTGRPYVVSAPGFTAANQAFALKEEFAAMWNSQIAPVYSVQTFRADEI